MKNKSVVLKPPLCEKIRTKMDLAAMQEAKKAPHFGNLRYPSGKEAYKK